MTDPIEPKPFWTFSPRDISVGTSGLRVTGWFLWCRMENVAEPEETPMLGMRVHYLTPFDEPMTFGLPGSSIKKPIDSVTAKDVIEALTEIFVKEQFQAVPSAPSDLPLHRIPPSRRAAIQAAIQKRRGRA